jgi:hypothetical protein
VLPEFCMPGAIWPFAPGGLSPVAVPVVVLAAGLEMDGVPVPAVLEGAPGAVVMPGLVVAPGVVVPVVVWA